MRKSKKRQNRKVVEQITDFDYNLEMRKSKKNQINECEENVNENFADFPVDIWFLISEHIRPEDVQTFGLICLKTAYVTTTGKFWKLLYRKYYDEDVLELPERLQPDCVLSRIGGLRANVIKSLFYTYPPFKDRRNVENRDDYDVAFRKIVINMSCTRSADKNWWTYHFKLKNRNELSHKYSRFEKTQTVKEQKINREVFCNPDEGCQLIEIKSKKFVPLPRFQDQIPCVKTITKTLSSGFIHYKLKMVFSNYAGNEILGDPLVFDPVISIRLMDWWHPDYDELLKES